MTFSYPALRYDGLRLLEPISIDHDGLSFRLVSYSKAAAPHYTAVSYTWGESQPTELIRINGQPFMVRPNLWSCLYHLSRVSTLGWTHLWVDAICVDQSNDKERAAQVRRMDEIYRSAFTVSVWLGLPPFSEDHCTQAGQGRWITEGDMDWSDSIKYLANRPYWTRLWVIQEFLLGRSVQLFCGDSYMNWDDFKDILGLQMGTSNYLQEDFDVSKQTTGSWKAWPLVAGRHPDRHPEFQQPLYKLLLNHSTSQCKDPRDRLFALLGLVTIEERSWLERFIPDYTMKEDDVALIALAHVRVPIPECFNPDLDAVLTALGIHDLKRRKIIKRKAVLYNYLGGSSPSSVDFVDHELGFEHLDSMAMPDTNEAEDEQTPLFGAIVNRDRGGCYINVVCTVLICGLILYSSMHPKTRNWW